MFILCLGSSCHRSTWSRFSEVNHCPSHCSLSGLIRHFFWFSSSCAMASVIPSDLLCTICKDIIGEECLVLDSCQHTFCTNCIKPVLNGEAANKECPNCRKSVSRTKKPMFQFLNALKAYKKKLERESKNRDKNRRGLRKYQPLVWRFEIERQRWWTTIPNIHPWLDAPYWSPQTNLFCRWSRRSRSKRTFHPKTSGYFMAANNSTTKNCCPSTMSNMETPFILFGDFRVKLIFSAN